MPLAYSPFVLSILPTFQPSGFVTRARFLPRLLLPSPIERRSAVTRSCSSSPALFRSSPCRAGSPRLTLTYGERGEVEEQAYMEVAVAVVALATLGAR